MGTHTDHPAGNHLMKTQEGTRPSSCATPGQAQARDLTSGAMTMNMPFTPRSTRSSGRSTATGMIEATIPIARTRAGSGAGSDVRRHDDEHALHAKAGGCFTLHGVPPEYRLCKPVDASPIRDWRGGVSKSGWAVWVPAWAAQRYRYYRLSSRARIGGKSDMGGRLHSLPRPS